LLLAVERTDALVHRLDAVDTTRPLADVELRESPGHLLVDVRATTEVLMTVWRRTMTLATAEAVGIAGHMLTECVAYATSGKQFGRPIGTYQAISHKLTDMYIALELSRALVRDAALAVDQDRPDASAAVAAAAAKTFPAATAACETAIQVHGGIGMTWESPLHRYYKRALGLAALDGPVSRHRALYAEMVFPDEVPSPSGC
jgi:alkylation response protein AidB-like acyl-CoA dehydrogenase